MVGMFCSAHVDLGMLSVVQAALPCPAVALLLHPNSYIHASRRLFCLLLSSGDTLGPLEGGEVQLAMLQSLIEHLDPEVLVFLITLVRAHVANQTLTRVARLFSLVAVAMPITYHYWQPAHCYHCDGITISACATHT